MPCRIVIIVHSRSEFLSDYTFEIKKASLDAVKLIQGVDSLCVRVKIAAKLNKSAIPERSRFPKSKKIHYALAVD